MSRAMLDASDPHAWLGHLSATVGFYLYGSLTRRDVEKAYTSYRQSPCVDDELREMLPSHEKEDAA
jgi:hypothetical protein